MTDKEDQFNIMKIGILISKHILDIKEFNNLEEIRVHLNSVLDINIEVGMYWTEVITMLERKQ